MVRRLVGSVEVGDLIDDEPDVRCPFVEMTGIKIMQAVAGIFFGVSRGLILWRPVASSEIPKYTAVRKRRPPELKSWLDSGDECSTAHYFLYDRA